MKLVNGPIFQLFFKANFCFVSYHEMSYMLETATKTSIRWLQMYNYSASNEYEGAFAANNDSTLAAIAKAFFHFCGEIFEVFGFFQTLSLSDDKS